jgi:pimeloyl-ACP methyl ester carboxylesterase
VDVEGSKLYYEECGTGPQAVVLIHDGLAHSAVWDGIWPTLCQRYHTIRYDRRGYGRSPAATSWYSELDDLSTLLRHLAIKHASLVASSHGAELSIDFTLQYSQLVKQLVLVGPVVSGMPYTDYFLTRGAVHFQPIPATDTAALIAYWNNDKYVLAPGHDSARARLHAILASSPQDLAPSYFIRPIQPALPRLREVRVPTLILVGDADIPDVHAHAGAIEAGIAGSRRIVLRDAGHLMYLEIADVFARTVTDFLDRTSY